MLGALAFPGVQEVSIASEQAERVAEAVGPVRARPVVERRPIWLRGYLPPCVHVSSSPRRVVTTDG